MKRLLFILLLLSTRAFADDTAAIQAAVSSGTLTRGTYSISTTITVNHAFNLNGSTVSCTMSSGAAFSITASVTVQNFHLTGATDVVNVSGAYGISVAADNVIISNAEVNHFPFCGIYGANRNTPTVQNVKVYDTGYIGIFFEITSAGSYLGGSLLTDTVDRSMLGNTVVTQSCIQIKGSATGNYKKWTVSNCRLLQPSNPTDWSSEGSECRFADSSTYTNIYVSGGSIGISIAKCIRFKMTGTNTLDGQNNEGLEYAGSSHCFVTGCTITNQLNDGILSDPTTSPTLTCTYDTLTNSTVTNPVRFCFYSIQAGSSFYTSGCTFTCSASQPCVEMNGADGFTFNSCSFLGATHATYAFEFEGGATGNISVNNSAISNIVTKLAHFTTGSSASADNINFRCITYTSVTIGYNVFGSYTVGSNVNLNLSCYTSGKLMLWGGKLLLH